VTPESWTVTTLRKLDLTRFGGHLTTYTGGVQNAEEQTTISA